MTRATPIRCLALLLAILPLSGCLFRSRRVERKLSTAPLKTATQQELIDQVNAQAQQIRTFQATVDIDTSVGGEKQGKVTDYKEIRGYVLLRKPEMLRMIGLMPIVRNKAFDMVSDGREFRVWIPPKNRFVIGRNDAPIANAKSTLETMRPQDIYEALLIHQIDAEKEIAVLENGFETVLDAHQHRVDQPDYELVVVRKGQKSWYLSRRIVFSRTDLQAHRQLIYDEEGRVRTEGHYEKYTDYSGISFPAQTEIIRPVEEYDITLSMVKLELNKALTNEQFDLPQPPAADVVRLDQPAGTGQAGSDGNRRRIP